MGIEVVKRDGRKVTFSVILLRKSIAAAAQACGVCDPMYHDAIIQQVCQQFSDRDCMSAVQIHHWVMTALLGSSRPQVAACFNAYRKQRDHARERTSPLHQDIEGLRAQSDTRLLHENANKDSRVIPTQRDLLAGIVARHYARNYLLPETVVAAHDRGEIHYHDLDYAPFFPMFNCMLIDLEGMLSRGFKMGNASITAPKSIATATAVTAQIIAQVASHIYGGTTINRIDEVLAPYVEASLQRHREVARHWQVPEVEAYAEARTRKECYDAFQALEYEVNTLHTANGQTPFVTFGFGLGTSPAARMIQTAILENRITGLGSHHKTAVFPKLVFSLRDGINRLPSDQNYDIKQLALKCASLRIYPDILNYDQVVKVTGSFKTPMGCRSFLGAYEEHGECQHEGRNNLGVVSLNLPRIALQANGDDARFMALLDQRLTIARQALMTRIQHLENTCAQVAPILYMEGACGVRLKAKDPIAAIFQNGRASISLGYIGLHECINALYGPQRHLFDSPQLQQKALAIVQQLRAATDRWKAETGYGFSLYSTPSENLCDRFCRLDRAEFGLVPGVTDKGYYTNSFHLDVEKAVSPYDKIDFEAPYPAISSGGFICYGEYPNLRHNLKALEDVWDYSYSRVPYYGANMPTDECYECGFQGEFLCTSKGFCCPQCGNHDPARVSVTRRVCGYLGSPDARPFNQGKQEEVRRRVKHLNDNQGVARR
nr:anaerobic ribonucleoside-triphosphate reductase [Tatumella saanichensis]